MKTRIFADRAQSAPYSKSGLRPVNEIRQNSDERRNGRRRSQGQHRDRRCVPLVFADLVREQYPYSTTDCSLGNRKQRRRRK